MKEEYGGGLSRFEEKEGVDMEQIVFAYNSALSDLKEWIEEEILKIKEMKCN